MNKSLFEKAVTEAVAEVARVIKAEVNGLVVDITYSSNRGRQKQWAQVLFNENGAFEGYRGHKSANVPLLFAQAILRRIGGRE